MAEKPRRGQRKTNPTWDRTNLAKARIASGVDQETMARLTGIPLRTYRKIETGEIENPGIRHLINCAIVLGMKLHEVSPVALDEWTQLRNERAKTPAEMYGPARPPRGQKHLQPERWTGG